MKLIAHHLWKNVWGMRWLLAIWFVFLGLRIYLEYRASVPRIEPSSHLPWIYSPVSITSFAMNVAWLLVIVRTIQAEPVRGTSSFWLTRPVPTAVALASRLAIILGLVILPTLLLEALVGSFYQLPWNAVIDMGIWSFLPQIILTLLIVWLATYTRNFTQFWAALGLMVVILIGSEIATMVTSFFRAAAPNTQTGIFEMVLWPEICAAVFIGGLIVSLSIQYIARATRPALIIGLVALLFLFLDGLRGIFSTAAMAQHMVHPDDYRESAKLSYQLDTSRPLAWANKNGVADDIPAVAGTKLDLVLIPPAPRGWEVPVPEFTNGSLQVENGPRLDITPEFSGRLDGPDVDWTQRLQQDHPELRVIQPSPMPATQTVEVSVGVPDFHQVQGKRGKLQLDISGYYLHLSERGLLTSAIDRMVRVPASNLLYTFHRSADGGMEMQIRCEGYTETEYASQPVKFVALFIDAKDKLGIIGREGASSQSSILFSGFGHWTRMSQSTTIDFSADMLPADVRSLVQAMRPEDWQVRIYEATRTKASFESHVDSGLMTF